LLLLLQNADATTTTTTAAAAAAADDDDDDDDANLLTEFLSKANSTYCRSLDTNQAWELSYDKPNNSL